MDKVKKLLGELESLFLEKNRCGKRMNNLQTDKKEIITLKNQNLERYTKRLKELISTKSNLEKTIKNEENSYNPPVGNLINNNSLLNTSSTNQTTKNKLNSDLLENSNSKDNSLLKSQCETNKNENNSYNINNLINSGGEN